MNNGPLIASLAVIALVASCSSDHTAAPTPRTLMTGRVNLRAPSPGGRFVQNDPSTGCVLHDTRGYGFRLAFDWDDVEGASRYDIQLKNVGAKFPAVSYHVGQSQYEARGVTPS